MKIRWHRFISARRFGTFAVESQTMENESRIFIDGIPGDAPEIPPDVRALLKKVNVLPGATYEARVHGPLVRARPPHFPFTPTQTRVRIGPSREGSPLHVEEILLNRDLIADPTDPQSRRLLDFFALEEATRVAILATKVFGPMGSLSRLQGQRKFPRYDWQRGGKPHQRYWRDPTIGGYLDPHLEFYDAREEGLLAARSFSITRATLRTQLLYAITQRALCETRRKIFQGTEDIFSHDTRAIVELVSRREETNLEWLFRGFDRSDPAGYMHQ